MKEPTNPFRFNKVVTKEHFCNRDEVGLIAELLRSNQNVALIGPRRTGKTSLALEVCRKLKRKVIHADMMRVNSHADIIKRMTEAALRDSRPGIIEGLVKTLGHLRPTLTIDPVTGGTQWTVTPLVKSNPEQVIDALRIVEKRCEATRSVLFIDEFQDLTAVPAQARLLAQMRSVIQRWANVAIIFAGSDREKMKAIFSDPGTPFYQSATVVPVNTIGEKRFRKYISKRFSETGRSIPSRVIDRVFAITEQHPNSTQKLLHFLWNRTQEGDAADEATLEAALDLTIRVEQDEFERTLDNMTAIQVRALTAVAKFGGETVTGVEFKEASNIPNPASVLKALSRCIQLKLLTKDGPNYRFLNPFFREWLKRQP